MDAISLLVAEFTEELIFAQIGLLSFFASYYLFTYVIAKRDKANPEWVPGAVVKDYLNEIRDREAALRQQLFGESSNGAQVVVQQVAGGDNSAILKELEAVRSQLSSADSRIAEKEKLIAELRAGQGGDGAEALAKAQADWDKAKAELEKKLADALANAGSGDGGANPELEKQVEEMRARLDEYEVIEDDLANLKKYQTENKKLREKLEAEGINADDIEGPAGGSAGGAGESAAEAPAEEPAAEAPAEEPAAEAPAEEPAAEAPAEEPAAEAPAEEPAAEAPAEEPAAETPAEEPAAAAADDSEEKSEDKEGKKKDGSSEEDLLSEFEKMLAS